jgi:cobalamin biosynthesis Mg chelatase CobN
MRAFTIASFACLALETSAMRIRSVKNLKAKLADAKAELANKADDAALKKAVADAEAKLEEVKKVTHNAKTIHDALLAQEDPKHKKEAEEAYKMVTDAIDAFTKAPEAEKDAKKTAMHDAMSKYAVHLSEHAELKGDKQFKSADVKKMYVDDNSSNMMAWICIILGAVLLLAAIGWYFYASLGVVVYSLGGIGLAALIAGLCLLFLYKNVSLPDEAAAAPVVPVVPK